MPDRTESPIDVLRRITAPLPKPKPRPAPVEQPEPAGPIAWEHCALAKCDNHRQCMFPANCVSARSE